ncbi:YeeE/YedE family protein [Croceitalea rosinachiae]|uniref:YeeE/YedE thiosulfate transporter family protein n=1 Tax=Croceitalea rosinachiae TaxID=3075596 RepID=A0ABU3A7Z1_9FLAO|nr:YeeE/YedE thiosulfate transporter family protein [Croceitalea sp. F388]MDT0605930.1 YeeE/YedE thiosulfate transporter family protein [Croceitalea sp. F388]
MDSILKPWPWYVSGPLIAFTMAILIMLGKRFGMSSNLRTLCTIAGGDKAAEFFRFDWKSQRWNLIVMVGVIMGGFVAVNFLTIDESVAISTETVAKLKQLGFHSAGSSYMPTEFFANEVFSDPKTLFILVLGGFLVGFGARYAGGCTSGHAISGLSNLQLPSLIAVIGFFAGGLLMIHFIFPLLF